MTIKPHTWLIAAAIATVLWLVIYALASCSTGPVIVEGKRHVLYKGNYWKFERRREIREQRNAEKDSVIRRKIIQLKN